MPRVLVVEDERLIAMMVQEWLTELGCQTLGPAHTVADALALIKDAPIDAAILDVSLQKEDCAPVAATLHDRGVPFAFATGHAANGLAARFPGAPSLAKPYDFEDVRTVVTGLLGSAQVDLRSSR
jgi:DNA-binding response OmpR family regulator